MDNKQLWKISKYVQKEANLTGQLKTAGSNTDRFLEKLEENRRYLQNISILLNVIMDMYIIFSISIPLYMFRAVSTALTSGQNLEWILFVSSMLMASFFFMQFALLVVFQMYFSMGVMSSESFKWLFTLPLSKNEIEKIIVFALFRGLRWAFLTSLLVLPIAIAIYTHSTILTLVALGISILNLTFSFSAIINIGGRMKKLFDFQGANDSKQNFIRIFTFILWFGTIMLTMMGISIINPEIEKIIVMDPPFETTILNRFLPVISFPFTGGYAIVVMGFDVDIPDEIMKAFLVGLIIYIVIIKKLIIKTKKKLFGIFSGKDIKRARVKQIEIKDIHVDIDTPIDAFFKRDKKSAQRDMQMISFIFIPFVYGFMSLLYVSDADGGVNPTGAIYMLISATLLIIGTLNVNKTGASVLASLPINPREQVKALMKWIYIIQPIAYMIPNLFLIKEEYILEKIIHDTIIILYSIIIALLNLELKVYLFGKMKYRFVLDEVNLKKKGLKWTIFMIASIGWLIFLSALSALFFEMDIYKVFGILTIVLIGLALIAIFIFNKMFPRLS